MGISVQIRVGQDLLLLEGSTRRAVLGGRAASKSAHCGRGNWETPIPQTLTFLPTDPHLKPCFAEIRPFGFLFLQRSVRSLYSSASTKMSVSQDVIQKIEDGYAKLQASPDCKSLLKKHLTKEVVDQLKDKRTKLGANLLDVSFWRLSFCNFVRFRSSNQVWVLNLNCFGGSVARNLKLTSRGF